MKPILNTYQWLVMPSIIVIIFLSIHVAQSYWQSESEKVDDEQRNQILEQVKNLAVDVNKTVDVASSQIIAGSDRNYEALLNVTSQNEQNRNEGEVQQARQSNASLAVFLPLLLDTDEDIEQIKRAMNISELPDDKIHIRYNGTFITVTNDRFNGTLDIPNFNITSSQSVLGNETTIQTNTTDDFIE